jgi:hypothetical protein
MRRATSVAWAMLVLAPGVSGQEGWTRAADDRCRDGGRDDRDRVCETRTRSLTSTGALDVDGGPNGGIEVIGWDGAEVEVTARVQAHARGEGRARELLDEVRLEARDGRLSASGPDTRRGEGWNVSWEIRVPHRQDLTLDATNGGLSVADVSGRMDLRTTNGGLHLEDLGGEVRGRTTNGGVNVRLTGARWDGSGLDVQTTNGGIDLRVPEGYSAELVTGTRNGGLDLDFPITVQGRLGRSLETTLGSGGPTVRAVTTNGGVRIRRP